MGQRKERMERYLSIQVGDDVITTVSDPGSTARLGLGINEFGENRCVTDQGVEGADALALKGDVHFLGVSLTLFLMCLYLTLFA